MDGATETQQRWVVDGNGWHDGDSTAMDGNGRRDRDLKAMVRLTAMGSNSTVMDGVAGRQWTVRWILDGNGRCGIESQSGRPSPFTTHRVESQLCRSLLSLPSSRCCPPSITGKCLSPLHCQSLSLIRLVVAFPLVTSTPPVHRFRSFRTAYSTFF